MRLYLSLYRLTFPVKYWDETPEIVKWYEAAAWEDAASIGPLSHQDYDQYDVRHGLVGPAIGLPWEELDPSPGINPKSIPTPVDVSKPMGEARNTAQGGSFSGHIYRRTGC
jgi:hypothetical protein